MQRFIRNFTTLSLKTCLGIGLATALSLSTLPAYASGGGGGGGGSEGGGMSGGTNAPQYDPVIEYNKGRAYLENKEYKKATKAFGRVLKVARKDANTNFLMGASYSGLNNYKKAARYYKNAVRYNANLGGAHIGLAKSYVALGKTDKANKVQSDLDALVAKCVAVNCTSKANLEKAQAGVRLVLGGDGAQESYFAPRGQQHAGLGYFKSVSLINQARYQDAIDELHVLAAVHGPHPDVMNYLGYSHRKLGLFTQAEHYYSVALAVDPQHRGANEYLGELYVETGQMEKAKIQLAKLERICTFGCIEENELRGWIVNLAP